MRTSLAFLVAAAVGCAARSSEQPASGTGRLEVSWDDSAGVARIDAPAQAHWCARDTLLEIVAVSQDSSVGIALFATDSLRVTDYPVFRAEFFAPWRPQATAALRLAAPTSLRGFQSTWGQVRITASSGGRVSGTLDLHLKLSNGPDSLHLTGRFSGLPVRPASDWCGRANKPRSG